MMEVLKSRINLKSKLNGINNNISYLSCHSPFAVEILTNLPFPYISNYVVGNVRHVPPKYSLELDALNISFQQFIHIYFEFKLLNKLIITSNKY